MAKTYVGVNGTAREVGEIYVGVNGIARRVEKAYVGDADGIARLVYQCSPWWLPAGVPATAVLAAYCFVGAASESAALTDLSGNNYNLTKAGSTATWDSETGFHLTGGSTTGLTNTALLALGGSVKAIGMRALATSFYSATSHYAGGIRFGAAKKFLAVGASSYNGMIGNGSAMYANRETNSGGTVYSGNFSTTALYARGQEKSLTSLGSPTWSSSSALFGNISNPNGVYIKAAAFYSVELTPTQHASLYKNLLNL